MATRKRRPGKKLDSSLSEIRKRKDILAGTLSAAYLPCNKGNCKCTRGELHGPTWRLSYKEGDKATSVYIRQEDLDEVKTAVARYAKIRAALQQAGRMNLKIFIKRAKR